MYLFENPVLQSELLVNLRKGRSFLLLFGFVAVLGNIVLLAWPETQKIDMSNPEAARSLVNLFFLGQDAKKQANGAKGAKLANVGVVGAGFMGSGIAIALGSLARVTTASGSE